jgi:hypothetical protein
MTGEASNPGATTPRAPRGPIVNRARVVSAAVGAGLATALTLAATATGVLFDLVPSLRPDPGTQLGADMRVLAVDRGVKLRDYLERVKWSQHVNHSVLDDLGDVAYVEMSVRGRKSHHLTLAKYLYELPSGTRLPGHSTAADQYFRDDTTNDQWVAQVFLPPMLRRQQFFARFELWEGPDLLAYADTGPIRGSLRRLE